jgi:hypothetical protein
MNSLDSIIYSHLSEEKAPITTAQFNQYRKQVDFVFNLLQQQIISLDVTCGLLLENQQIDADVFKAEVKRRVQAVAEGMAKQAKQAKADAKVSLV